MRFSDIIGEKRVCDNLRNAVDNGRVAHAQLFEGETGYGTLAIALAYVQYINCQNRVDGDSCGVCSSCLKIDSLQHPDLHFVFPVNKSDLAVNQSKTSSPLSDNLIGVFREHFNSVVPRGYISPQSWFKAMRLNTKTLQPLINKKEADSILDKLMLKSVESVYKTFIIWLPESMNEAAANTLLKQFEEPVGNALFLFVTENSMDIIKTILSRVQTTTIPPITREDMAQYITDCEISNTQMSVDKIVSIAKGSVVVARQIMEEVADDEQWFEQFVELMRYSYLNQHINLLEWVDSIAGGGREELDIFFINSIEMLRCSYMKNMGLESLNTTFAKQREFLEKFYKYVNNDNIEQLLDAFELAQFHISRNGNVKIVMTHFALSITKLIKKL